LRVSAFKLVTWCAMCFLTLSNQRNLDKGSALPFVLMIYTLFT